MCNIKEKYSLTQQNVFLKKKVLRCAKVSMLFVSYVNMSYVSKVRQSFGVDLVGKTEGHTGSRVVSACYYPLQSKTGNVISLPLLVTKHLQLLK